MLPRSVQDPARPDPGACTPHAAFLEFFMSTRVIRILALGLALALAACATTPPPADLTPPPRKGTDAKTQLESGRRM
jgi:hypothetical protein